MSWLLIAGVLVLMSAAALKYFSVRNPIEPAPGSAWVEPTTGMQFVWVPSGCFNMGSEKGLDDQKPVHRVCVSGFYLGKYEVTQGEYEKIVGANPCATECTRYLGSDRAVTNVRWNDIQKVTEALSQSSGSKFRLPSEAEWEYACRAGELHKDYCGDGRLDDLAWIGQSRYGSNLDRPQSVGTKKHNAWGLFDMMGNVSEYVLDCWHGNYNGAPKDGSAWVADGYCNARITRGGSWDSSDSIKATYRGYRESDSELIDRSNGFRLVKLP
jgi:formylglycine-generating enzyme required for sulfatase activity